MNHKIIVESFNDQAIYKHILDNFCQSTMNPEISTEIEPITNDLDWIELNGLNESKLSLKLKELQSDLLRAKKTPKIGIIIDLDDSTISDRIDYLNVICSKVFEINIDIKKTNEFNKYILPEYNLEFELGYCFSGLNGKGELEHILINIADTTISYHADCLKTCWVNCLNEKGITFREKDLRKLWIDFYKRYDCLTSSQKNNAGKYTQWQNFLEKHPNKFDFSKEIHELNEIKIFLTKFSS